MNVICCCTITSSDNNIWWNNGNILLDRFTWTFQMPNQEAYGRIDEDTTVVALLVPEICTEWFSQNHTNWNIGVVSLYLNKDALNFFYILILVLFLFIYLAESFLLLPTLKSTIPILSASSSCHLAFVICQPVLDAV